MGGTGMKDVRGAVFAGSSPPLPNLAFAVNPKPYINPEKHLYCMLDVQGRPGTHDPLNLARTFVVSVGPSPCAAVRTRPGRRGTSERMGCGSSQPNAVHIPTRDVGGRYAVADRLGDGSYSVVRRARTSRRSVCTVWMLPTRTVDRVADERVL